jgi:hypothetical protein
MDLLSALYFLAFGSLPITLGLSWWAWIRGSRVNASKWRSALYFSGLCAATVNFMLFWAFVVWLQFHYTTEAYKVRDPASNVGLILLLYSLVAVSIGKGRYRFFVGTACILAMIPWIPIGVL